MILKVKYLIFLLLLFFLVSCKKKDDENPVVTLRGNSSMTIILNTSFTDPGADANDNTDGAVSVNITGEVNPDFAGTYYIVYSATDASGNTGEAIRRVVVKNEAELYSGNYAGTCYLTTDTTNFAASATVSTVVNKRIWIAGFASYPNASVFADISNDTIRFPAQTAQAGNPAVTHKFEGNGLVKTINDTTVFEIHFSDSVSGNISNGFMVYKK
ncbi:MAG TPA: DUF5011 domain-containing protein [Bacteroidales bacterium]|nr:DUF5011 domain-containing protein [Bacteroidales bacterium]